MPKTTSQISPKKKLLKPHKISVKHIVPNLITILSFCSGLTSMRFAIEQRWEGAILSIVLSMVLDAMDGRVARILNATTKFGANLDSLSDLVCFGVAPAFLIYCFSIGKYIKLGWSGVMFFTTCMALRLARFNTMTEEQEIAPNWLDDYFLGVPAPAGALLAIMPICFFLATDMEVFCSFTLNVGMLWFVGLLLVSRLPTLSFKSVKIDKAWLRFYSAVFALFAVIFYNHIWLGLASIGAGYLITLPYTYLECRKSYDQDR